LRIWDGRLWEDWRPLWSEYLEDEEGLGRVTEKLEIEHGGYEYANTFMARIKLLEWEA